MKALYELTIEPLNAFHDRPGFRCGIEALDKYLKKQSKQDMKRRISRVYIAVTPDNPKKIMGYYTLSSLSIGLQQWPEKLSRKLPKHPISAALIGRLAVNRTEQGNGVGRMLLADAIKRTMAVSDEIAIFAIVVDAINDAAQLFYERFGFQLLDEERRRLFLPLKSIEQ